MALRTRSVASRVNAREGLAVAIANGLPDEKDHIQAHRLATARQITPLRG